MIIATKTDSGTNTSLKKYPSALSIVVQTLVIIPIKSKLRYLMLHYYSKLISKKDFTSFYWNRLELRVISDS